MRTRFSSLLRAAFVAVTLLAPALGVVPVVAAQDPHGEHGEAAGAHGQAGAHGEAEAHGEHGAAHDAHGVNVIELVASFVNFAVLLGLLVFLAKKPTKAFLTSRRAAVVDGLAEAQRMKAAAEAKYNEYQKRLANLDAELAQIKSEIIASGEAERERIIAEAERKSARIRRETEFLIEQQLKQLRVDLTRESVEAAMTAAEKLLRERTTDDDQQRLARAYTSKLAPAAARPGGQGGAA
jgi:F-type H+-transporting ATPase subunit b